MQSLLLSVNTQESNAVELRRYTYWVRKKSEVKRVLQLQKHPYPPMTINGEFRQYAEYSIKIRKGKQSWDILKRFSDRYEAERQFEQLTRWMEQ